MSVSLMDINGDLRADTIEALVQFDGSGAGLTANTIPRTSLVTDVPNAQSFLYNNGSGNITANSALLMQNLGADLHLNPSGVIEMDKFVNFNAGSNILALSEANIATTNATPSIIIAVPVSNSTTYVFKAIVAAQDNTNNKALLFEFNCGCKVDGLGVVTASGPFNYFSFLDPVDAACELNLSVVANTLNIRVLGIALTNIDWGISLYYMNSV